MVYKYSFYTLLVIFLFCTIEILSISLKTNYSFDIPQEKQCSNSNDFQVETCLGQIKDSNIKMTFNYSLFINSANICNIKVIRQYISELDTIFPSRKSEIQEVFSIALTNKLAEKIHSTYENYQPDSLIQILQWSNRFHDYSDIDTENSRLYEAIYYYWVDIVSNQLGRYADKDANLKYNFKFKYIAAVCHSKQFETSVGFSHFEKIIFNTIDKNWAYLYQKFWGGTGALFKILISIFTFITLCGYICICKSLIKLLKRLKR